jgi:hypothetical protein
MRRLLTSLLFAGMIGVVGCQTCDVCDDCGDTFAPCARKKGCSHCGAKVVQPAPAKVQPAPVHSSEK